MAFRLSGSLAAAENGHESFAAQHYYSPLQSGPVASSTNPAPAMPIGHWKRQLRESGVATCVHAQCQINFLSLAGIVAHSKTCSGYAPAGDFVPCNVCGLRFKQYKSMQSHRDRNHYHQVVGVAPPPPAPSGNLVLKEVSQYSSAFGPNTTVYVAETEPAKRVAHRHRPNVLRSYSRVSADKGPTVVPPTPKMEDQANVSYLPPDIAQEVLAPTYTERVDAAQKAAITSRLIAESQMISTPRPAGRPITYYTPRKPAPTLSQYHDPFDMSPANGAPQYELNPPKVEPTALPGYQTLTVERQTTPRRQTQLKPIYIDASPAEGHYYEVSSSGQNSANGKQFRYIDVGPNQSGGRRIIFANSNLTITQQQQSQQPQPPPTPVSLPSSAGSEVSSYSTTPSPAILSESGHSIERDQSNRQTFDSTSSVQAQYRYEGQEMTRPSSIQPQSSVNEIIRPLKMSPNASSGGPSPSCASSQPNPISHQVKEQPPQQQPSTLSDIDLRERELADEEAKLAEYERIVLESEEKAKEARRKRLEEREAQLRLRKEALQKRHLQAVAAIETAPKVEEDLATGVTPRSEPELSQVSNPKHEPSSSGQQEIREIDASSPALLNPKIPPKDTLSQDNWSDSGDCAKEQIVVPVGIQERLSSEQPETPAKIAEEPSEDTITVPEDSNQTTIVPQESQDEEEKDVTPLSIPRSIPVELITTREGSDGSIQTYSEITEIIPEGIALDPGAKVLHISTDGFTETLVMHTLEPNEEHHTSSNEETRKEDTQTKTVEPPQLQELEISSGSRETESIEPEVRLEPMVETEVFPDEVELVIEPQIEAQIEAEPNVIVQGNEILESTNCNDLVAMSKTNERGEDDSEKAVNEISENQTSEKTFESQPNLDAIQESIDQSDKQSKHLTEEKEEEENAEPEQNAEEEKDNQPLERKKRRRTMTKTQTPIVPITKIPRKSRARKSLEPIPTPEIEVQTPRSRRAQKRPVVDKSEPSEPQVKKKSSPKTPKSEPKKCVRRSKAPKFQCGKCDTVFSTNRQFEAHVAQEHSGLARLIGESQEFKTKERDSALRSAFKLAAKVKCCQDQCDRVFSSYAGLQYHLRTCQKSPDEIELMKLKCRLCDYRGFPMNMRLHELRHPAYQKTSPPIEDEPVDEETPSPNENQSEDFNDNSLTQSGRKRRRAATKASVKVNETIKILKTKVEGDVSDIDERDGDDDQDEVFNVGKAVDIKAHYKINKKEKTFSCLHCKSICSNRSDIESHLMSAHSEEMDDADADEDEGFPDEEFSEEECSLVDKPEEEVVGRSRRSIKGFGKARHRLDKSSVLSSTTDLIPYEGKFRQANFEKNPFSDFHSMKADWTVLDQDQARDYLPENMESLQFNSRHCSVKTDHPLKTSLKLFQSLEAEADRSVTFFTGGPIRSSAWLPMSDVKSEWAYLALSSMRNMSDGQTFVTSAQTAKGLIQIWRVHVKSLASEMVMGLSHDLGTIWDMTWVPSGNQIPSEDPCHLRRLGILACASSEGTIRVFSICLFSELENPFPGSPLICQTQSKRTLRLCANPDLDEPSKSACVTLSWFRGQNHRVLAGGFCDGRFALWDLFQPEGSLQRQGQDIYPYLHHSAHTAGITALDLNDSPSHSDPDFPRELVTGSYDRGVAVWDLDHPTLPTQFLRKGLVMGLDWLRHHPGEVMVSFDDVFLQSHTQSVVFDFASPNVKAHPVMAHNSAVWSQSTSPWLNVMATASTAGEVILFMAPPLTRALENDKDTNRRRIYLYTTNVSQCVSTPPEIQSNDNFGNVEKESLEFVDVATGDIRSLPIEIQKKTRYFETMPMEDITRYPIRSVNQIRLNSNPQNLGLVFSGTQAGFGRIHFVESLLNPEIRSQLKKYLVS